MDAPKRWKFQVRVRGSTEWVTVAMGAESDVVWRFDKAKGQRRSNLKYTAGRLLCDGREVKKWP